ncbi:hypothetical protein LCGC14_0251250 [marine sediment metagenome]|uniref:Uncharacterized protein n=1 Tax=marine sediment metagenome TaxID=412755 RepID=A0A0F9X8W0_9ZZZZ
MTVTLESIAAATIPSGKLLAWIAATGAALFMAGVGATLQFGSTAENIEAIPAMQADIAARQTSLDQLLDSVAVASEARAQILCVVVIAVGGEVLTAPEVIRRCP